MSDTIKIAKRTCLQVRISPLLKLEIEREARLRNIAVSEYVRRACTAYRKNAKN